MPTYKCNEIRTNWKIRLWTHHCQYTKEWIVWTKNGQGHNPFLTTNYKNLETENCITKKYLMMLRYPTRSGILIHKEFKEVYIWIKFRDMISHRRILKNFYQQKILKISKVTWPGPDSNPDRWRGGLVWPPQSHKRLRSRILNI